MNATAGSIMILDDEGNVLTSYSVQNGRLRPLNSKKAESAVTYGLAGWVVMNQEPVVVDNTLEDPRWLNREWEVRKGLARSDLSLPLVDNDRVRAVVTLTREDDPFSEIDLQTTEEVSIDQ
jgi:GAF domain-containing protein